MKQPQILDSFTAPLNHLNLIEASAGTGKTYTIENLFARLIVQESYSVDQILTVTFTEAATSELKRRIRHLLQAIAKALQTPPPTDGEDSRITRLAYGGRQVNIEQRRNSVDQAMHNFDEAAIHTIHGFCGRILYEYAFETATLFNTELEGESEDLIQEIVNDFFRSHYYAVDRFTESVLHAQNITPDVLFKFIREYNKRYAAHLQPAQPPKINLAECQEIFQKMKQAWDRDRVSDLLEHHQMNRQRYKPGQIERAADNTERFLAGDFSSENLESIQKFAASQVENNTNAGAVTPECEFFNICDAFLRQYEAVENYKILVYHRLIEYFQTVFLRRKLQRNIHTFDDLLKKLHTALYDCQKQSLVRRIRQRFQVVLIDEFQDTDALQYAIFKKLFIQGNKTTFLVGDPKQAIYRFRGADVHVYHQARRELQERKGRIYTLDRNYRSTPNYIFSINQLFRNKNSRPFASKFIEYYPVRNHGFDQQADLTYKGKPIDRPVRLFYLNRFLTVPQLEDFALRQTAREIFSLLTDENYRFGIRGRHIMPSDIAVLVDRHQQARALQPYLQAFNIPFVLQATGSVFDSPEAQELELLLHALAEPNNLSTLKGALTTHYFDLKAGQLYGFDRDVHGAERELLEQWITLFRECQLLWEKRSFLEMFNYFVSQARVKDTLLSQPQGERRVTNLLHLVELLQQEELEQHLSMTGLITWFIKQRNQETREGKEAYEIRMETDARAVKIRTVHKSKGLEFPILFCPFLWSRDARNSLKRSDHYEFHDRKGRYIFDLIRADENMERAADENLAELLRLAYVALTRGNYLCYLVWGHIKTKTTSALDYLSCRKQSGWTDSKIGAQPKGRLSKTLDETLSDHKQDKNFRFAQIKENYPKIEIFSLAKTRWPAEKYSQITDKYQLKWPQFTGDIEKDWGIISFSSLVTPDGATPGQIGPDYDALVDPESKPEIESGQILDIFNFPAGKRTGNCWHHIFEKLDYTADEPEIKQVVDEELAAFHLVREADPTDYKNRKRSVTLQMVKKVLTTPLLIPDPDFQLGNIAPQYQLAEREFNFPIERFNISTVEKVLQKYNYQLKLSTRVLFGFLNGYIDLIFRYKHKWYIVDWKSNQITGNPEGFAPAQLQAEMDRHSYALQYLIYTLALHRYLAQHIKDYDYEQHFGGVFYLFLRGIDPAHPGRGIYFDRPEKCLIEQLNREIRGT